MSCEQSYSNSSIHQKSIISPNNLKHAYPTSNINLSQNLNESTTAFSPSFQIWKPNRTWYFSPPKHIPTVKEQDLKILEHKRAEFVPAFKLKKKV